MCSNKHFLMQIQGKLNLLSIMRTRARLYTRSYRKKMPPWIATIKISQPPKSNSCWSTKRSSAEISCALNNPFSSDPLTTSNAVLPSPCPNAASKPMTRNCSINVLMEINYNNLEMILRSQLQILIQVWTICNSNKSNWISRKK